MEKNGVVRIGTPPRTQRACVIDAHGESTSSLLPPQDLARFAFTIAWRMIVERKTRSELAITRGIQALRKPACALLRGVETKLPDRTLSSYESGTRGSYSASGGWVEMCASASSSALLLKNVCYGQTLSISEQCGCGNS